MADPELQVIKGGVIITWAYRWWRAERTLTEDVQRELYYKQQYTASWRQPENLGYEALV